MQLGIEWRNDLARESHVQILSVGPPVPPKPKPRLNKDIGAHHFIHASVDESIDISSPHSFNAEMSSQSDVDTEGSQTDVDVVVRMWWCCAPQRCLRCTDVSFLNI